MPDVLGYLVDPETTEPIRAVVKSPDGALQECVYAVHSGGRVVLQQAPLRQEPAELPELPPEPTTADAPDLPRSTRGRRRGAATPTPPEDQLSDGRTETAGPPAAV